MRNQSVTIAKGLAIILMVMGHARCPEYINNILSLMRMPLFFIMSGYCFKEKYLDQPKDFFNKRMKGIYLPYIKWSLFFLLIHNICFHLNIYNDIYGFKDKTSKLYEINDFLSHGVQILTKMGGHEQLLGGYWFLKSLFFGSFIFYFARKYIPNIKIGIILLLLLTISLSFFQIKIPYFAIGARETFAAFFMMFGHYYKTENFKIEYNNYFNIVVLIFVIFGSFLWRASLTSFTYLQVVPYACSAIVGTLFIFNIGHILEKKVDSLISRFLIFVGNHTFNVLTWHFISFKIVSLLLIALYGLSIEHLAEFPVIENLAYKGWWVLYLLIGACIPIVWMYYYHQIKNKFL